MAGFLANAADHFGDDAFDLGRGLRMFGGKARAHLGRGLFEQDQEMRARNVASQPDLGRQGIVVGGAIDQHAEAGIGKARAGIAHHRMDDVAIAALDQHIGHRFAQRRAPRDRQQMLLALGAGADQEVALVEPLRQRQHRAGDVDIVVEGQHVNDVGRRIGDRRDALRQPGAGLALDGVDEPRHDVVEHADLLFGIARGVVDEEIGDAGQDVDAARNAPRRQRGFELVEEGKATHYNSGRPQRRWINAHNAARTVNKAFPKRLLRVFWRGALAELYGAVATRRCRLTKR